MDASHRAFSLAFVALLAAVGAIDAVRHGYAVHGDARRMPSLAGYGAGRGSDSSGVILGPLRGGLDRMEESYGDLSEVGRLLPFRRLRRERFSTDPFGYRNPDYRPEADHDVVILGDCFLDGDDSELFHRLLEESSGLKVYNYHGMKNLGMKPADFLADGRLLRSPPRYLVVERVERGFNSHWAREFMSPRAAPGSAGAQGFPARLAGSLDRWGDASRHSILKEAVQWTLSTARYGIAGRLPGSIPLVAPDLGMLFFAEETQEHALSPAERGIPEVLDSLQALDRLCRARGIRLVVLMVPDKYSIYGWKASGPRPPDRGGEAVGAIGEGLADRSIPFVDLFGEFRRRAPDLDSLLYYPDDTRWTPHGRRVAARETARLLGGAPLAGSP